MDKLKPPHELKIAGGNLADRWERFLERFRWYLAAVGEDGSEGKIEEGCHLVEPRGIWSECPSPECPSRNAPTA